MWKKYHGLLKQNKIWKSTGKTKNVKTIDHSINWLHNCIVYMLTLLHTCWLYTCTSHLLCPDHTHLLTIPRRAPGSTWAKSESHIPPFLCIFIKSSESIVHMNDEARTVHKPFSNLCVKMVFHVYSCREMNIHRLRNSRWNMEACVIFMYFFFKYVDIWFIWWYRPGPVVLFIHLSTVITPFPVTWDDSDPILGLTFLNLIYTGDK